MKKLEATIPYVASRRRFLRDSMLVSLGVWAAACAPGQPTPGGPAAKGGEFHGNWPYDLPPKGHYNYFASGAILSGGIYTDLFLPTLAIYRWAEAKWDFWLAESAKFSGDNYEVKLRSGLKWDDGKPFSSKDVATTYWIGRMQSFGIWNFVDKLETPDDLTVRFHFTKQSSLAERFILKNGIRPDSAYGGFAKRAADLYSAGRTTASDEIKAVLKDLGDLRPAAPPSVGPYKIDPASVTEAQLTFVRNGGGLFADRLNFDRVVIYQGDTAQVTPLVLAGDIDYSTSAFPLATDRAFQDQGLRIIRGPLYTGPALYFHWEKVPQFQDKRLRQAVAMAVNRDESGKIYYGQSARAPKFMAGFADGLVPTWLSAADQAKLTSYAFDAAKADALMKDAGYSKGSDGVWQKDGKKLEFELYYPSDFTDWAASASYVSDALNKFGFKITPRGAPSTQELADVRNGVFQIAFAPWGTGNPHPQPSLVRPFREFNTLASGGGQKYPVKQQTSAGTVDFDALLDQAAEIDPSRQKDAITKIAFAFNELLPVVPLYERLNNNPVNEKKRVAGWPPDGDKIYTNGGGDNFAMVMLMDGTLHKP